MEKWSWLCSHFSSVCQTPFISNKSIYCAKHSNVDEKYQESMRWMQAFDYSIDVSRATYCSLETCADLQTNWEWPPFSDTFASCNTLLLAEGVWSAIVISAVSRELHLLFFIREEICLHLSWKADVHKQSELNQISQVQGQINSAAAVKRLSPGFLVLTHSKRSDLIVSSLDLCIDL